MRLNDLRSSGNVEDRRGAGGFGGGYRGGIPLGRGGLSIGGVLFVLAISYFTGISPSALLGGGEAYEEADHTSTTSTPDDAVGRFVSQVLGSTEDTWTQIFAERSASYRPPKLVLFSGATGSACGTAQSAMGPFYCPNDRKIYLDTEFFREMRARFNACPQGNGACAFAQAYVIAHEVGHHIQNALGILSKVDRLREAGSKAESNALSVRLELQADCFAGLWANHANKRSNIIEAGDVEAALQTANAIGDDTLQRRTQGTVVPDSFTHGSAEQRQRWFNKGLKNGSIESCNTFTAASL